jgi:hypothetical protein
METLKIDIQSNQEKKVLLAFLDSLNYHHRTDRDDCVLTDEQVKQMIERKANFLAGKTTSRSWNEIKRGYQDI